MYGQTPLTNYQKWQWPHMLKILNDHRSQCQPSEKSEDTLTILVKFGTHYDHISITLQCVRMLMYCAVLCTSGETGCFSKDKKEQGYAESYFWNISLGIYVCLWHIWETCRNNQWEKQHQREDRATSIISSYKIANNAMVMVVLPEDKASRHGIRSLCPSCWIMLFGQNTSFHSSRRV